MLNIAEREFISSVQSSDSSTDFLAVINYATANSLGHSNPSLVKPKMAQKFLFSLYSKLLEKDLIRISENNSVLHVLNNISNFKLAKDNDRLMYFIIGEIRTCQMPQDVRVLSNTNNSVLNDIILV